MALGPVLLYDGLVTQHLFGQFETMTAENLFKIKLTRCEAFVATSHNIFVLQAVTF